MSAMPPQVAEFLAAKRIVVAGVSRSKTEAANAVFRRLRDTGHDVVAVNPHAVDVEGQPCCPDLAAVPGPIDAVMVVTHPDAAADVARAALDRGVRRIWFHRSFGAGSVASEALALCRARGVEPIEGGCPLMYGEGVDPGHRFMRWCLGLRGRVPG